MPHEAPLVGFRTEEIDTSANIRSVRLKWVIVLNQELPAGPAANAAVCAAAASAVAVPGLTGPPVSDADGLVHPGLPWTGCTVLSASGDQMTVLHEKTLTMPDVHVADMVAEAQSAVTYNEWNRHMRATRSGDLNLLSLSVVGPRNRIAKLTKAMTLWDGPINHE